MNALRYLVLAAVTAGALTAPRPAAAIEVRLELAPQVAIPIGSLIDGVPIAVDDNLVGETLVDIDQSTGGGFALALLLDDFEIRYEFASMAYKSFRITHAALRQAPGLHLPADLFTLQDGSSLGSVNVPLDDADSLLLHHVWLGYRFTPFDWVVRPYLPFGVGFAVAQLRNGSEPLFGFNVQIGLGVDWVATRHLHVGLEVRYNLSAFKNRDTGLPAVEQAGIRAAVTNTSSFESVMETLSTINVNLHVAYRF